MAYHPAKKLHDRPNLGPPVTDAQWYTGLIQLQYLR